MHERFPESSGDRERPWQLEIAVLSRCLEFPSALPAFANRFGSVNFRVSLLLFWR